MKWHLFSSQAEINDLKCKVRDLEAENEKLKQRAPFCVTKKKQIPIEQIYISKGMELAPPAEDKMAACRNFYRMHGYLDRQIILANGRMLIDGYCGYLVLKESGAAYAPVLIIKTKMGVNK